MDEQGWLTTAQVAEAYGLTTQAVNKALKSGKLKGEKDNLGHNRFRPSDVDAWRGKRPKRSPIVAAKVSETAGNVAPTVVETVSETNNLRDVFDVALSKIEEVYKDQITKLEAASERDRETIQKLRDELDRERGRGLFSRLFGR